MAYNYEYPYVDPNRYNADWLLSFAKEAKNALEDYKHTLDALGERDSDLEKKIGEINAWIENSDTEVAEAVKRTIATMIMPGITDTGYIVYNIPENWGDITFNTTGLDIVTELQPDYGHLVLSY